MTALQGFSFPLSPTGDDSLLTPPPWHFAGSALMVDFVADPERLQRHLPDELAIDPEGRCAAVFAEWQWRSDDARELSDPAYGQFGEFLLLVACTWGDRPVARVPFAWVDDVVAMTRGWVQGMPKQMGRIGMTRSFDVGRVTPHKRGVGSHFANARDDKFLLCEASVNIPEGATHDGPPPALHTVPLVHVRHDTAWTGDERPDQLVMSEVTDVEFSPVTSGEAQLSFGNAPMLADFAPTRVGDGHLFDYAETLVRGRLGDGTTTNIPTV